MFIVTGGGSGIGKALALALSARGKKILIVGRREALLRETAATSSNIQFLCTDIATVVGRDAVFRCVEKEPFITALINNAGILEPLAAVKDIALSDWQHIMATNLEAPLCLTQLLYSKLNHGRVLNIGSGAAHFPSVGLSAYCTTKAALYMLTRCFQIESNGVAFASVMPGIVDSVMQETLRDTTAIDTEKHQFYNHLKQTNYLVSPQTVAAFLCWLLLDIPVDTYVSREWDIYNKSHHASWLKAPHVVPNWGV